MLRSAFIVLSLAVLLGAVLALARMRGASLPWQAGALHGSVGAGGLTVLYIALRGPQRGAQTGVQSFGYIAAIVGCAAFIAGLGVLVQRRRNPGSSGFVLAVHATAAITAYVILAAYIALS